MNISHGIYNNPKRTENWYCSPFPNCSDTGSTDTTASWISWPFSVQKGGFKQIRKTLDVYRQKSTTKPLTKPLFRSGRTVSVKRLILYLVVQEFYAWRSSCCSLALIRWPFGFLLLRINNPCFWTSPSTHDSLVAKLKNWSAVSVADLKGLAYLADYSGGVFTLTALVFHSTGLIFIFFKYFLQSICIFTEHSTTKAVLFFSFFSEPGALPPSSESLS